MRTGVERVREAKAQKLRKEYENLAFKGGESIEDFTLRLSALVTDLQQAGDDITEEKAVKKLLHALPPRIKPVAVAMESCLDLARMSIEELSGRLSAAEDGLDSEPEVGGKLMLTEE